MSKAGENRSGEETYIPMPLDYHEFHMDCRTIKLGPTQ